MNIFQEWLFSRSEYFSGGEYFQEMIKNIFHGWIFFRWKYFLRGEYFSGWINFRVNKFQGWMFSRGHRSSYSLNIWLSANILGLVIIIIDIMSWHFAGQVNLFGYLERWACWMLSKLFSAMHWNEGSTATMRHGTSWQLGLFSKYSSLFCIKVVSEG